MQLIKNKINGEIVYRSETYIDLLTIYNLNLKRNFPDVVISDYEVIEVTNKADIKMIKTSAKIKHKEGKFDFTPIVEEINYERQIDKTEQLQCQILMLQKKINDLTQIINDTKSAMTTMIKTQ